MNYLEFETKKGKIFIRDADYDDLKSLVAIYENLFVEHNLFRKEAHVIMKYLEESHHEAEVMSGGYVIALTDKNETVGAVLVDFCAEGNNKHSRWRYKHLGVREDFHKLGIGTNLIKAADEKIKTMVKDRDIKSAKVEVKVSENEKETVDFYKKNGFKLEGTLSHHFRLGENCYILGKLIK